MHHAANVEEHEMLRNVLLSLFILSICSYQTVFAANQPAIAWKDIGFLPVYGDIKENSDVTFSLRKDWRTLESYIVRINSGQQLASQWPYYLGQAVNARSTFIHIGQMDAQGNITPIHSDLLNKVYVKDSDSSKYFIVIDSTPADCNRQAHPK